jgi:hypothetical protein
VIFEKLGQDPSVDFAHLHKIMRVDIVFQRKSRSGTEIHLRIENPVEVFWVELQTRLHF